MAAQAELLETVAALAPHRDGWDALAVASGRPYCAPGWMLSWLREVAPPGALLRACVAHEGRELVGIAPFWTLPGDGGGRYGLLGERTSSPVEPLSAAGREPELAALFGELLAEATPRPREIELKGAPSDSVWPALLAERLSGNSGSVQRTRFEPLPRVGLRHSSMEDWLATRSRNFRQQLRQGRRRLEEAGATFRASRQGDFDRDLASLARLHHARWRPRGGSRAMDERVEAMLRRAARDLGEERVRLLAIDVDGVTISAHLFVRAGPVRGYWLGGFDDSWAACRPSLQVLATAVEEGIAAGEAWLELGPGGQEYKYRLADSETGLAWVKLAGVPA